MRMLRPLDARKEEKCLIIVFPWEAPRTPTLLRRRFDLLDEKTISKKIARDALDMSTAAPRVTALRGLRYPDLDMNHTFGGISGWARSLARVRSYQLSFQKVVPNIHVHTRLTTVQIWQ